MSKQFWILSCSFWSCSTSEHVHVVRRGCGRCGVDETRIQELFHCLKREKEKSDILVGIWTRKSFTWKTKEVGTEGERSSECPKNRDDENIWNILRFTCRISILIFIFPCWLIEWIHSQITDRSRTFFQFKSIKITFRFSNARPL